MGTAGHQADAGVEVGGDGLCRVPGTQPRVPSGRFRRGDPGLAATIVGFAFSAITAGMLPELNTGIAGLRDVLGDQTYQSLARTGEAMSTAAMATYAYDQIDQARAELTG